MRKKQKFNRVHFVLIFGIVFILSGIVPIYLQYVRTSGWQRTIATVTTKPDCFKDRSGCNYIVSYQVKGVQISATMPAGNRYNTVSAGGSLPIKYNPDKPDQAVDASGRGVRVLFIGSALSIAIGIILFINYYVMRKRLQQKSAIAR